MLRRAPLLCRAQRVQVHCAVVTAGQVRSPAGRPARVRAAAVL